MIGNSQRLQGYRSYGVRRAISSTPSKVTGLRRLQRSLSDKFQRYSPNFDIIIIIIILEVDIKGCEVAKVSGFHRAIFTHITCHYCYFMEGKFRQKYAWNLVFWMKNPLSTEKWLAGFWSSESEPFLWWSIDIFRSLGGLDQNRNLNQQFPGNDEKMLSLSLMIPSLGRIWKVEKLGNI